ncbi:MAG: energy transducer TonB [Bryobacteraceae bacterium]|jgi:protein TonB
MAQHTDILDQQERLKGPFMGSIALHVSVVAAMLGAAWVQTRTNEQWGSIKGGGFGSVTVNPVARIPLPTESGPVNPVANDTESRAPTPPPKAKAQPKAKAPPPDAIPLPSRNAERSPSPAASAPNKFREQQQDLTNQVYSPSGQRLNSPMIGMAGGGGVSLGNNSPFGARFGEYAMIVRNRVGQAWRTGELRISSASPVVVTFTILRDGSVPERSVQVRGRSGNAALDISAQRAILDAQPFPPLPAGFPRSSADVEFTFDYLRR